MTRALADYGRKWIPVALAILGLFIFGWYIARNGERYLALLQLSSFFVIGLLVLAIGTSVVNGFINYHLFLALNADLGLGEAVGLAMTNTLANQLPFSGGLLAKGVYLKQRHQLAYSQYLSATMALFVFSLSSSGFAGLFALLILDHRLVAESTFWILPAGFLAMCASCVVFLVPIDICRGPMRWHSHFLKLDTGWQILRREKTTAVKVSFFHLIGIGIVAARFWIAFHSLSQDVSYVQCILFSAGTILTQLVSITPGGLGIREGIVAGMSSILGFEPEIAVVAVALDRLIATTVIIAGGVISTYFLGKQSLSRTNAS